MKIRLSAIVVSMAAASLFGTAACGDDETTTTTTTTTTATTGSSMTGGGSMEKSCEVVCGEAYACFASECAPVDANNADQEAGYTSGCLDACNGPTGAILKGLVNPDDCAKTVGDLSAANADAKTFCDTGGDGEGGAGGAGTGGSSATGGSNAGGAGGA